MKKSKFYLFSAISGILAVICLIAGIIVSFNLPSGAAYEVARAFGDTEKEDFLFALNKCMGPLFLVFAIIAIGLLIIAIVQSKRNRR